MIKDLEKLLKFNNLEKSFRLLNSEIGNDQR